MTNEDVNVYLKKEKTLKKEEKPKNYFSFERLLTQLS